MGDTGKRGRKELKKLNHQRAKIEKKWSCGNRQNIAAFTTPLVCLRQIIKSRAGNEIDRPTDEPTERPTKE